MDNLFLVDLGNSSVKWSMATPVTSINDLKMFRQRYPEEITTDFFMECWHDFENPQKLIASCVADNEIWQALEEAALRLWNIKAERVISKANGYGVNNAYTKPSDLGSDRWCALIGALHATDSDVVVVDCGTAITLDVMTQSGQHLGGYIVPGINMMKQSLGIHTAQINLNNSHTEKVTLGPANSTTDCVDAGVYLAAVGFIESVFKQQQKSRHNLTCLLTGGDASLIAKHLTIEYVNIPNLVLHGLAHIAEYGSQYNNK